MNDRPIKTKKNSNTHCRPFQILHIDKHPSTSSVKQLQGHCLPKNPPNITAYHHYGHPRKQEQIKENLRCKENDIHLHSTRDAPLKTRNILLQQRKSNQQDDPMRKTQKKLRKGALRSEWVSPDEEGLGCHEHLSSQIFRQSGHSGVSQRKSGQTGCRPMSTEEQLNQFERRLPSIAWKEDQQSLAQLIRLQEQFSRLTFYGNYLQKHTQLNWMRRAFVLDWAMLRASELQCNRETYALSVSLLDRFLAVSEPLPISKLQLTTAACLLIAEKLQNNTRIRANQLYEPISEGHSRQQLLATQIEISIKLKFRLRAPTVNAWANRLCTQWDMWITRDGGGIQARFKAGDIDSYQNWRWIAQYIDFALLDIQTLQYKNRTLAAAFLYLTLLLKLQLYSPQQVTRSFRKESHHILDHTPFNDLFSRFLLDSFGFPLEEILPAVQYCSNFSVLPLTMEMPPTLDDQKQLSFQQYCGIQTWNQCNKGALYHLDRTFW